MLPPDRSIEKTGEVATETKPLSFARYSSLVLHRAGEEWWDEFGLNWKTARKALVYGGTLYLWSRKVGTEAVVTAISSFDWSILVDAIPPTLITLGVFTALFIARAAYLLHSEETESRKKLSGLLLTEAAKSKTTFEVSTEIRESTVCLTDSGDVEDWRDATAFCLEAGRRFQSDLQEAKRRGFLSKMPSYNSVFRYLESEALTPYLYELIASSSLPLKSVESDFAVDSSGFSTGQFMRWFDVKYGKEEDRRMWIKVHLMCGVKTNIVTSVEISDGYSHDYNYFKPLVETTAGNGFKMAEISADKGYIGATNLLTSLQHGAIPYIPFKINAKAKASTYGAKSKLWDRMLEFYTDHREEFLTHYHKRSNVETTFHMIKAKFGQRLRSKTLTAQINEALCKVLCHNLCVVIQSVHELGIDATFSTELAA